MSTVNDVCLGLPKGFVLGPILYLFYINDIGHNPITSDILMFGDNSVLIQTNYCMVAGCEILELDLTVVSNYLKSLKLGLNAAKTKIMHFDKGYKHCSIPSIPKIHLKGKVSTSLTLLNIWGMD